MDTFLHWTENIYLYIFGGSIIVVTIFCIDKFIKDFSVLPKEKKIKKIKIIISIISIIVLSFFSYEYYQNRIPPFQKILFNCNMNGKTLYNYKQLKYFPNIPRIELPKQFRFSLSSFSNVDILYPKDFVVKDRSWNLKASHYYGTGYFGVIVPNTPDELYYGHDHIEFDINFDWGDWGVVVKNGITYNTREAIEPKTRRILDAKYVHEYTDMYGASYICRIEKN